MTDERAASYRKLFDRLDAAKARNLIDRLQVLALTRPDTVHELETFLDRNESSTSATSEVDRDPPNSSRS